MTSPALALTLRCPKCLAASGEPCVNRDGSPSTASHVKRFMPAPCGTPGGYIRHVKAAEIPCDDCREGHRRYMQEYRKRRPEKREADIAMLHARRRAERRLIALHLAEFDVLVEEERAR